MEATAKEPPSGSDGGAETVLEAVLSHPHPRSLPLTPSPPLTPPHPPHQAVGVHQQLRAVARHSPAGLGGASRAHPMVLFFTFVRLYNVWPNY